MAKQVSATYGDALFAAGLEDGRLNELSGEVLAVSKAIEENPDLTKVMNHPKIDKEEKMKMIEDIFNGRVSRELVGLMRLLVEKGHYKDMQSVFSYFTAKVKEHNHIGTAYVTSAMELSEKQKENVKARLLETTEYEQFEMHYNVDAAIIGGMIIRIGDRVVDSSVKTKLEKLTRELSQIQLKEGECAP